MNKLMYLWYAVKTVLCTCEPDHNINNFEKVKSHYQIKKIGTLPAVAAESSGLAAGNGENSFWTHNDSGRKAELYEFSLSGKLLSTKIIPGAKNTDWEDLAKDLENNLYIGDFGNNAGSRNTFEVYKILADQNITEKITFEYAGQKGKPATSKFPEYDCEAFFYYQNNLYLFSKNWTKDKQVKLYRLPAEKGNYSLSPVDSIYIDALVTSADVSPDGKTFAVLTYGKVLLFGITGNEINFKKPLGCFRLVKMQNEAIQFLNNTDMLVTNEQGSIYRITYR